MGGSAPKARAPVPPWGLRPESRERVGCAGGWGGVGCGVVVVTNYWGCSGTSIFWKFLEVKLEMELGR